MALSIEAASLNDIPTLTDIYMKAFSKDLISLRCFPRTAEVKRWWTAANEDDFKNQPSARFLKVVENGQIVAYAKWNVPVQRDSGFVLGGDNPDDMPNWPKDGDPELCEEFFGALAKTRREVMGDQPHYYLEIIATLPEHQGKGAAGRLIRWGLDRADQQHLEAYIEASPAVVPIYEHFAWKVVAEFSPSKVEHTEYMMRRSSK